MPSLRVLQLSDTHLFAAEDATLLGIDTDATLRHVCEHALERHGSPDLVLATGDLAHEGEPEAYERLLDLVNQYFRVPLAWIPGNHDSGPIMARYERPIVQRVREGAWELILLDSHVEGEVPGRLGDAELERLARCLADSDAPNVLIALHHHLLPIGADWLDEQRVADASVFMKVIEDEPRLRLIVFGHVHQEADIEWKGVRMLATPSTCFQFLPRSERFALDAAPPACRWLELYDDGTFYTEVTRIEAFELPERVG